MIAYLNWLPAIAALGLVIWAALDKDKAKHRPVFIASLAFVIGIAVFGSFLLKSRQTERNLRVTGYASKLFESDLVKWSFSLQKNSSADGLKQAYTTLSKDVTDFKAKLVEQGFAEKDINIQPPTSSGIYSSDGYLTSYSITQEVYVISSDIPKLEKTALDPSYFADRGLLLQHSNFEYLYTKLPDLKKQLISEATSDALDRAKEIANAAHTRLGKLKSARAGVFQITEPYSTDVSDYGYYSTSTRSKSIAVTVSAEFNL